MLPAAIGYFPDPIRHFSGGFLLGSALEGLLLAQLTLLAFWVGLGRGRIVWRFVGVAVGCVYLAVWPTMTQNGASVGDLYMSLIHTCELNGANAFEYLTALQQHADEVAASPEGWLPWNYRDALSAISPAG